MGLFCLNAFVSASHSFQPVFTASSPSCFYQQQSGLISRVTDTVKSIVPSWLQKYFKNEDAPEEGGAVLGTEQNCQPPPPPNGSEEGPLPLDGRDSPEPSTSNAGKGLSQSLRISSKRLAREVYIPWMRIESKHICACQFLYCTTNLICDFFLSHTEPSTSRASLNFQEYVLSRPPLSRSHLHFPPLDASSPTLGASSSLFSQPSTSSAPGPFSTGFSLVKEIKDNLSQHEDDNISTTSGFSSRASDKGKSRAFEQKVFSLHRLTCCVFNVWDVCIDVNITAA